MTATPQPPEGDTAARRRLAADLFNLDAVATWKVKAYHPLAPVADPEDREVIEADLATLP